MAGKAGGPDGARRSSSRGSAVGRARRGARHRDRADVCRRAGAASGRCSEACLAERARSSAGPPRHCGAGQAHDPRAPRTPRRAHPADIPGCVAPHLGSDPPRNTLRGRWDSVRSSPVVAWSQRPAIVTCDQCAPEPPARRRLIAAGAQPMRRDLHRRGWNAVGDIPRGRVRNRHRRCMRAGPVSPATLDRCGCSTDAQAQASARIDRCGRYPKKGGEVHEGRAPRHCGGPVERRRGRGRRRGSWPP